MGDPVLQFDSIAPVYDESRIMPGEIVETALGVGLRALGLGPGARVLDCGCGTGQLASALLNIGCAVVGVDPSVRSLDRARAKLQGRATFVVGRGEALPFAYGSFDAVVVAHVLEHVSAWKDVVNECLRVCAGHGGVLLFFSPGFIRSGPRTRFGELLEKGGWLRPRRGLTDRRELVQHLEGGGVRVDDSSLDSWSWVRETPISVSISALERRVYSRFLDVPDETYDQTLRLLRHEYLGREDEIERIRAKIEVLAAHAPSDS